jgi:hypothetical protein
MKTGGKRMRKHNNMSMGDHYIYTPSTTDVTIRWRANYNWTPPSENPQFIKKWADFRMRCAQGIEQIVDRNMIRKGNS